MKAQESQLWVGLIGLAVPAVIFIIATILNFYMREGLFLLGVNLIYDMQDNSGPLLNFIENLFSMLGNPIVIYAVIGVQYLYVKQRIRTIVHLTYIMAGLYFMVLLKQAFQESRPFWFNPSIDILEWFCPTDFGNPSGHSFITFAMYEPLLSDFLGTGKKKVYLFVWAAIAVLVVISRMYLGAHSLDQVVFGSLIGLSFLVIYRFWLQQFLYDMFKELLNQKGRLMVAIITASLWILFLILPIVSYQLNVKQRPIDNIIAANINSQCQINKKAEDYQKSILYSCITPFLAFGFIIGFIFTKNVDKEDSIFMAGLWAYPNTKSFWLFLIALIIVVGLPTGIFVLLIPIAIQNAAVAFLFKVVGMTLAGFSLILPMAVVQRRFSLIALHPNDETE